jgi:hypothetical protein
MVFRMLVKNIQTHIHVKSSNNESCFLARRNDLDSYRERAQSRRMSGQMGVFQQPEGAVLKKQGEQRKW